VRKSIVIFGIIMAFILGSLVSAPSVYAPQGEPFMFLEGEIIAIKELIKNLEEKLNNVEVTWDNVVDKPYVVLHHEQSDSVPVPSTIYSPALIELAVWKIVKDSALVYDDTSTVLFDSSVYANINGNVEIGWYKSNDRITWDTIDDISVETSEFRVKSENDPGFTISSQTNFIAFGTANLFDEGPDSMVKDFSGTMTIHLPPGQSLDKICCSP